MAEMMSREQTPEGADPENQAYLLRVLSGSRLCLHQVFYDPCLFCPPGFNWPPLTPPVAFMSPHLPPHGVLCISHSPPHRVCLAPPQSLRQELIIAPPIVPTLFLSRPIFHSSGVHCSMLMWTVYLSISLSPEEKRLHFFSQWIFFFLDPSDSRKRLWKTSGWTIRGRFMMAINGAGVG